MEIIYQEYEYIYKNKFAPAFESGDWQKKI